MDGLLELNPNLIRVLASTSPASLDRLFRCAAAFLDEGALETRVYGKRIIWGVRSGLPSRSDFDRLVAVVQPATLSRKVLEVVESSNGPPPPPSRGCGAARCISSGPDAGRSTAAYGGALGVVNGVLSGGSPGPGGMDVGARGGPSMYSISAPVGDSSGSTPPGGRAAPPHAATPDSQRLAKAPSWRSRTAGAALPGILGAPQPSLESTPTKSDAVVRTRGSEENARLGSRASHSIMAPADSEVLARAMSTMLTSKDFRARIEGVQQIQVGRQIEQWPYTIRIRKCMHWL